MRIPVLLLSLPLLLSTAEAKRIAPTNPIATSVAPPPALMIKEGNRSRSLRLTKAKVNAKIIGHLAETEITMTFHNPSKRVLEGDLYVPLPQGATISGYALDVNGTLVDGVVVEKDRARQAFETEVRKGVDPGLVEWTKGNNFKTRVFPIPANGTRTIRVSYVSEVTTASNVDVYHLPLGFRDRVDSLSFKISVLQTTTKPIIARGGPKGLSFGNWQKGFVAEKILKNATITDDLFIQLPRKVTQNVIVETAEDGTTYFAIRDTPSPVKTTSQNQPTKRIAIYWDASLSRAKANHKQELELLEMYLKRLGAANAEAVVTIFRNEPDRARRFQLPSQREALLRALRTVTYDGGTQISSATPDRQMKPADVSLLFSDGVSTFGNEDANQLRGLVYTINSATTANHAALRYIAMRAGGRYLNLQRIEAKRASQQIGRSTFSFHSAQVTGAEVENLYPKVREAVDGPFALVGKLKHSEAKITLRYGFGDSVVHTNSFTVSQNQGTSGNLLRRYWAQKKLSHLLAFPDRNQNAITRLGKQYSIVTPGTSLIVLERLDQYLEHEIRPPKMLAKMRRQYDQQIQKRAKIAQREQDTKLKQVIRMWEARVAWWNTKFKYPKNYRYGRVSKKKMGASRSRTRSAPAPVAAAEAEYDADGLADSGNIGGRGAMAKTESKAKPTNRASAASIALKPWDPQTPYLRAIKSAPQAKRYSVYLTQRKTYRDSPAFFLDCADYFHKQKQPRIALRILSNLAELELENPALLRVLAHRLAQIDKLNLSALVFKEVKRLRPEEPQSYRDLALVLERRADLRNKKRSTRRLAKKDYLEAIGLLAHVVMSSWDRFAEIEVIALTELNHIIPKARALGANRIPIDRRLEKHLDMDVRIVMTWDADSTDMDLHVVEPSGEEAYYSHNRTKIGGMVSRDFTRGYGPEVYALRRAMPGTYTIRTKYFGSSAAKLSGGVTLQVDVYTNYGRRNQKRKSMTLRLTESKETFTVGSIKI